MILYGMFQFSGEIFKGKIIRFLCVIFLKNMKINKLRMADIKKTLNYHHIFYEKKHKKLDLHFILVNYFKTIEYYTKNIMV